MQGMFASAAVRLVDPRYGPRQFTGRTRAFQARSFDRSDTCAFCKAQVVRAALFDTRYRLTSGFLVWAPRLLWASDYALRANPTYSGTTLRGACESMSHVRGVVKYGRVRAADDVCWLPEGACVDRIWR